MQTPPLRYLSAADVETAMPQVEERLALARRTMTALVADAQLPPKIGVDPAPADSFAHAMPAWARGDAADGSADLLGVKWVVGFPKNAESGLPVIAATTILNDAVSGLPRADPGCRGHHGGPHRGGQRRGHLTLGATQRGSGGDRSGRECGA